VLTGRWPLSSSCSLVQCSYHELYTLGQVQLLWSIVADDLVLHTKTVYYPFVPSQSASSSAFVTMHRYPEARPLIILRVFPAPDLMTWCCITRAVHHSAKSTTGPRREPHPFVPSQTHSSSAFVTMQRYPEAKPLSGVRVFRLHGFLFFGNATKFRDEVCLKVIVVSSSSHLRG
jgi:hypothetical protein